MDEGRLQSMTAPQPILASIARWLGVDPIFIVITASYLVVRCALAEVLTLNGVRAMVSLDFFLWVFAMGVNGAGTVLLGAWLVGGPGRLAARAALFVSIALAKLARLHPLRFPRQPGRLWLLPRG